MNTVVVPKTVPVQKIVRDNAYIRIDYPVGPTPYHQMVLHYYLEAVLENFKNSYGQMKYFGQSYGMQRENLLINKAEVYSNPVNASIIIHTDFLKGNKVLKEFFKVANRMPLKKYNDYISKHVEKGEYIEWCYNHTLKPKVFVGCIEKEMVRFVEFKSEHVKVDDAKITGTTDKLFHGYGELTGEKFTKTGDIYTIVSYMLNTEVKSGQIAHAFIDFKNKFELTIYSNKEYKDDESIKDKLETNYNLSNIALGEFNVPHMSTAAFEELIKKLEK